MSLDMLSWNIINQSLWSMVAVLLFVLAIGGLLMLAWIAAAHFARHREHKGLYGYRLYRDMVGSPLAGRIVPERRHRSMPQYLRTYADHGRAHHGASGYA